jgi:phage shock protein C
MNCTNCRKEIPDSSNFCNVCGAMQLPAPTPTNIPKRLFRSSANKKIAGVCGGIAEYLQIDSTIVRLIWLVLIFIPMPIVPAIVAYFVAWLVMPQAPLSAASVSTPSAPGVPHSTQTA